MGCTGKDIKARLWRYFGAYFYVLEWVKDNKKRAIIGALWWEIGNEKSAHSGRSILFV